MTHATGHSSPDVAVPVVAGVRSSDFVQLSKLRITLMVAMTASMGFGFGVPLSLSQYEAPLWWKLFFMIVGTSLSCMGAGVMNQIYERHTDGLMIRTRNRPMPAGRVSVTHASLYAVVLCVLGVTLLALTTTTLAACLAALTIVSYVLIYTPLKRISSVSTIVGALPGALPPVIGFAAARGELGKEAWVLFGILFLWQLPHFLAIAWLYREDYARAGLPMLPVVDPSGDSTFRQSLLGCLALLPLGLMPTMLKFSGLVYFFVALVSGLAFLWFAFDLVRKRGREQARTLFFASLIYLPVVFIAMLLDRVRS